MFLQAENQKLLKELVDTAIDQHVEFRKFKYFPLDPNYVNASITEEKSFQEAVTKIKKELLNLSGRLNNSVPFFNFRSQVRESYEYKNKSIYANK